MIVIFTCQVHVSFDMFNSQIYLRKYTFLLTQIQGF